MNWQDRHNIIKKPKAQSLVEFAVLLPMLLLLILGAMDLGRLFYTKIVITNAAREGANYLAYFPEDKDEYVDGVNYLGTRAAIAAEGTGSTVVINFDQDVEILACCTYGDQVGVKISKTVDLIFDNILQTFGALKGPVELTSIVWMRVQYE